MNSSNTNKGGWPASEMYTYVNEDIYNALPEDLKEGIIKTKVISGHEKGKSSNYESTDKLYLLSGREIYQDGGSNNSITTYDAGWNNTRQLDYYKQKGVTTSSYSDAVKEYDGSAFYWWLRAAYSGFTFIFYYVNSNGAWDRTNAGKSYGVAPAFRLG